jgi:hypothetical protein
MRRVEVRKCGSITAGVESATFRDWAIWTLFLDEGHPEFFRSVSVFIQVQFRDRERRGTIWNGRWEDSEWDNYSEFFGARGRKREANS